MVCSSSLRRTCSLEQFSLDSSCNAERAHGSQGHAFSAQRQKLLQTLLTSETDREFRETTGQDVATRDLGSVNPRHVNVKAAGVASLLPRHAADQFAGCLQRAQGRVCALIHQILVNTSITDCLVITSTALFS